MSRPPDELVRRLVGAGVASANAGRQVRTERRVVLRDLRDGGPDPARDGDAHPIGVGRGPPAAPAEAGGFPELLRDRFQLDSRAARSPEIVARLGVAALLPKLGNAPS